jgi:hypothetical protein
MGIFYNGATIIDRTLSGDYQTDITVYQELYFDENGGGKISSPIVKSIFIEIKNNRSNYTHYLR